LVVPVGNKDSIVVEAEIVNNALAFNLRKEQRVGHYAMVQGGHLDIFVVGNQQKALGNFACDFTLSK
jgi:hypothetical protein